MKIVMYKAWNTYMHFLLKYLFLIE